MTTGRKNLKFYRGVLENAGLGEVAFFLKKAKQNTLYAAMALDGTDFSSLDELSATQAKIVQIRDLIAEVGREIEQCEQRLASDVLESEMSGELSGDE